LNLINCVQRTHFSYRVHKTILAVGNEQAVLKFVSETLRHDNCTVLSCRTGKAALQQSRDFKGEIDLLLSAFEMLGISGIDLAAQITRERPEARVLLMSGFTGGLILLDEEWHFLCEPFIPSQLRALIAGLISPERKPKLLRSQNQGWQPRPMPHLAV
jgi:two-component system cell cycle sensor histidine kinase/response regulator CckA